jgi:hypothetical protein
VSWHFFSSLARIAPTTPPRRATRARGRRRARLARIGRSGKKTKTFAMRVAASDGPHARGVVAIPPRGRARDALGQSTRQGFAAARVVVVDFRRCFFLRAVSRTPAY